MSDNSKPSLPFWSKPCHQLIMVFIVALILRCAFVLYYGPILTNDSTYYIFTAQAFLRGEGLGLPSRVMPLYPFFVAVVYAVAASNWLVIWVQAILGALTCVVLAATCRQLFQPKLAFVLGLITAIYVPAAAFSAVIMRETMIGFCVSVTTYCLVRLLQERKTTWQWATGVASVATLFCQPTFLFFPVWMGIACWVSFRKFSVAARAVIPVVICLSMALGLWAIRNYRLTSHFIPMTGDHIGCYFLEGIMDSNEMETNKRLTPDQVDHLGIVEDDPYNSYATLRDNYIKGDLETKLRDGPMLLSRGLRLVQYEPLKYLRFSLKRLHRLWVKDLWVERSPDGYLNLRPLDQMRSAYGVAGFFLAAMFYALGYSSLIGIAVSWRRTLGLIVPVFTVLSFHMWVHAETRYALAIHPHLLIFSVITVFYLWLRYVRGGGVIESQAVVFK